MQDTNSRQGACLPPDFHSLFVVGAKEVIGAVMLHCLTAILPHIENCRRKVKKSSNPGEHISSNQYAAPSNNPF